MKSSNPVRPLIRKTALHARVRLLGRRIRRDYRDREPVLVGVLQGAFVFMADLVREIDLPLACEFLRTSSYTGTRSGGRPRVGPIPAQRLAGRHVLVVEDIVDTGLTVRRILRDVRAVRPASLRLCSLLSKRARRRARIRIDYLGFEVPDRFVVGYGLDFDGRYRNLPYVGILEDGNR